MTFLEFRQHCSVRVDKMLEQTCQSLPPGRLAQAMSYSLFNGGKRVRPILAYGTHYALSGNAYSNTLHAVDIAAAAIECIHAYSLIHDDLPAMDDDDLRRGKPTCHIAYDDATAILAGDGLQTLAFELISRDPALEASLKVSMIDCLARACGASGMVAGQAIDLESTDKQLTLAELEQMHRLKTGALIDSSITLGGLAAGNATDTQKKALTTFGQALGLAFQVQDDILDVISDTQTLGKSQGADIALNKPTYVSLLGLEKAQDKSQELYTSAMDALAVFDEKADHLRDLARYVVNRDH